MAQSRLGTDLRASGKEADLAVAVESEFLEAGTQTLRPPGSSTARRTCTAYASFPPSHSMVTARAWPMAIASPVD
jgi:hypothetical protein